MCVWAWVGLTCNKRKVAHMKKKNSMCGPKWVQLTKNHQQKKVWAQVGLTCNKRKPMSLV